MSAGPKNPSHPYRREAKDETLRTLAEKATPGPWEVSEGAVRTSYGLGVATLYARVGAPVPATGPVSFASGPYSTTYYADDDAPYIAAANPKAILALLDELDALRIEHAESKAIAEKCYVDEKRAERVFDKAKELLALAFAEERKPSEGAHEDACLGAYAVLSRALQGEEPYVSWDEVRAEFPVMEAVHRLQKERDEAHEQSRALAGVLWQILPHVMASGAPIAKRAERLLASVEPGQDEKEDLVALSVDEERADVVALLRDWLETIDQTPMRLFGKMTPRAARGIAERVHPWLESLIEGIESGEHVGMASERRRAQKEKP